MNLLLAGISAALRVFDRLANSRLLGVVLLVVGVSMIGYCSGCVGHTDATGAKVTDWPATTLNVAMIVEPTLQASVKVAARAVAAHNPSHATEFQLSGAAASALFDVAAPTSDNFKAALLKSFPTMAPTDAADLADILAGGWSSIAQALQQQGVTLSLTTFVHDPNYRQASDLVIGAIVSGFNDGVVSAPHA